jgi:hypothetical protein
MQPVFGYPSSPQRIRLDEVGEGVRTGPEPGRDNAGILEEAFKLARPGDTLIGAVDHDGDPSWLPQCTFLDRRIRMKIPTGVELTGPNGCPTAQSYVRRYHAQDWRESVFGMESGSVLSNCIIYLADGFSAGYPFGVVTGVIDGLCITRTSDKLGVLDLYVGGQAATPDNATGPSYKVQLRGPQLGTSCYLNDADRILIEAPDIDNVNLAGRVTNSRINSQVPAVVAVYGTGNVNNWVNGKPYPA